MLRCSVFVPPIRKTKQKSKKKKQIKKRKKRIIKPRTEGKEKLPKAVNIMSLQIPSQSYQSQEERILEQKLEYAGFHPQQLTHNVNDEILRRFSDFQNQPYEEIYQSIFAMITYSNALRNNKKIPLISHLPFFEDVKSFHEDLLLLRFSRLGDILEPARTYDHPDLVASLIERTHFTLSKISNNFPKSSLENNIFLELKTMLAKGPLEKFINFCKEVSRYVSEIEKHAKDLNLHDAYVNKFSNY